MSTDKAFLRAAGYQQMLPSGLLVRAALHRHTDNFPRAHQDLQEVFDIAKPSGMRLHLTDDHLEMARLLLAEGGDGGNSTIEISLPSNRESAAVNPTSGDYG